MGVSSVEVALGLELWLISGPHRSHFEEVPPPSGRHETKRIGRPILSGHFSRTKREVPAAGRQT
jgi:hypothetical protein